MSLATSVARESPVSGPRIAVIGKESVGKSQLVGSLTGGRPATAKLRGTTIACEVYRDGARTFVDTPGILHGSDSLTTRLALAELAGRDLVLMVVSGTHLDEDLADLLPLVLGKSGAVVVTFWDMAAAHPDARATLARLEAAVGVRLIPVDARALSPRDREEIARALEAPRAFPATPPAERAGWTIEPPRSLFELPVAGPLLALACLFAPAWIAVSNANRLADALYEPIFGRLAPVLEAVRGWPMPLPVILAGDYGFLSMGPFLLLYAMPTVLVFALLLGALKASGLIDRLTVALDPALRRFGLSGRDLVRVIMGFGCNVPAVINSRSCASCSRGACVSAISFGSACSYQLPATLAVFAATGMEGLAVAYLGLLAATTLVYLRLTVGRQARRSGNRLKLVGRDFLQWPTAGAIWRDAWNVVRQFFSLALPVFFLICLSAALLDWVGILPRLARLLAPAMALFGLPGEASLAVILGSVRKDGIAIGLLDSSWQALKVPLTTPVQVLTVVYLAGVLLPCMVTLLTVVREMSAGFAWRMVGRQVLAAVAFSLLIAWGGALLF